MIPTLLTTLIETKANSSDLANYLTKPNASFTYQPISSMSNYLTTANASSTYQPISSMSGNNTLSGVNTFTKPIVQTITGSNNIFIGTAGTNALQCGAIRNTVVGSNAGTAITTGSNNTLIGRQTGNTITTDQHNTYVGSTTGQLRIGNFNTAIGPLFTNNREQVIIIQL